MKKNIIKKKGSDVMQKGNQLWDIKWIFKHNLDESTFEKPPLYSPFKLY